MFVNSLKLSNESGKFATLSQYIYNSNIIDYMKIYKIFFVSIFLLTILSCKDVENHEQVYPNVEFVYIEKSLDTMNALTDPNDVLYSRRCVDTIVTDSDFICKFVGAVDSLEDDTMARSIDIRIVAKIHLTDSTETVACFGGYHGIMVDNVVKKHSSKLFHLINNMLYDEVGWRKLITRSYFVDGDSDIINTPEVQEKINESIERVRKWGDLYPGF